jgi:hypothetical protein
MAYFVNPNQMPLAWASELPPTIPQPLAFTSGTQPTSVQLPALEPPVDWGKAIVRLGLASVAAYALYKVFDPEPSTHHCSICGSANHNRRNCPHDAPRIPLSGAIPKSRICECCGRKRGTQRHHTRGRSDDSDFLDLCNECHMHCGHKGRFQNIPVKPRNCVLTSQMASWRTI